VLQVKEVSKKFEKPDGTSLQVLTNISLSLRDGEILGVFGSKGSGRSTLLRILSGVLSPDSGFVCVDGERIDRLSAGDRRRMIGRVASDSHTDLPSDSTVEGILSEALAIGSPSAAVPAALEHMMQELEVYARRLADFVSASRSKSIGTLTVGERQLIAILRTILARPNLLVLDGHVEPLDTAQRKDADLCMAYAALTGQIVIVAKSDDFSWVGSTCTTGTRLLEGKNHNFVISASM